MGFFGPEHGGHAVDLSQQSASGAPVFGVKVRYPAGHIVPRHTHDYGHIIYADRGLLRVEAESGQWIVPPTAAVWLRPNIEHGLHVPVALQAYGLFVRKEYCDALPADDCVIHVDGLVRELIEAIANLEQSSPKAELMGQLLIEELKEKTRLPLHLPWPSGPYSSTIAAVCEALVEDPSDTRTASELASRHAMTEKTLHRHFVHSTGMTFGRWRQRLRLLSSIAMLVQGLPITQIALASGYESHSAYTTAFRKQFGASPSQFIATR